MLNAQFFSNVRTSLYSGSLPQSAVDSFNTVCTVFDSFSGTKSIDDLAIILATVLIETGLPTNLAVEEVGKGRGKPYGVAAGPYNLVYYGRGPCQCTWLKNYQTAKTRTNIDFVRHPELMCDPHYGVLYMIDAMYAGVFTGKGLRNYVTPGKLTTRDNFVNSRRIINGLDRADEHADYCVAFRAALVIGYDAPASAKMAASALPALPPTAQPTQSPQRRGLVWDIAKLFGKG